MPTIRYEQDYLVGGPAGAKLTPNFTLQEFRAGDGSVRVHRDLIGAAQVLRDALGAPLRVHSIAAPADLAGAVPGNGLVLTASDQAALQRAARILVREGWLDRVEPLAEGLYVQISDPGNPPPIAAETAFDYGLRVTAAFETSGDPYQQVTGNFDGAGLSFGPIQTNLGTGTLQELFRRLRGVDEPRLRACIGNEADYRSFWQVLDGPRTQAVAWADGLSKGRNKTDFAQPWKGYLQAVGREPVFQQVMRAHAYDKYGKLVLAGLVFLQALSPVRVSHLRCLAALFDAAVQQGGLAKAHDAIRARLQRESPQEEFALTRLAVEERARKALPRWRADALSRRLAILERQPVPVNLDGQTARRDNPCLYLLRNSGVKNLNDYLMR